MVLPTYFENISATYNFQLDTHIISSSSPTCFRLKKVLGEITSNRLKPKNLGKKSGTEIPPGVSYDQYEYIFFFFDFNLSNLTSDLLTALTQNNAGISILLRPLLSIRNLRNFALFGDKFENLTTT